MVFAVSPPKPLQTLCLRLSGGRIDNRRLDLDVVRGVAILLAMGWHLGVQTGTGIWIIDVLFWPPNTFGWVGVDLFFVLSGFLMGRIVFREYMTTGGFQPWRFLIRRAFKLWPVFYVFLVAQVIFGDNPWDTFFVQSSLHVQNYIDSSHPHLWSLAVEEHFYLALAIAAPIMLRKKPKPRTLLIGFGSLAVASILLRLVGALVGQSALQIQTYTHFRVDGLAVGVCLAIVSLYFPSAMDSLLKLRLVWFAVVIGSIWYLVVMPPDASVAGATLGYMPALFGSAAFMLLLYKADWVPRLHIFLRPVGWLGMYSYALYLWHMAAASLMELIVGRVFAGLEPHPGLQLAIDYVGAILVAVLMTRLIEQPALKLRDHIMPGAVKAMDGPARP